jgi:hypothetical protein
MYGLSGRFDVRQRRKGRAEREEEDGKVSSLVLPNQIFPFLSRPTFPHPSFRPPPVRSLVPLLLLPSPVSLKNSFVDRRQPTRRRLFITFDCISLKKPPRK